MLPGSALAQSLAFLIRILQAMRPRVIRLIRQVPPLIIYTDAATSASCPSGLRLGFVLFDPANVEDRPLCDSFDVPLEVVDSWIKRETYITQAELLILPVVMLADSLSTNLQDRDIIWFVDNQAAMGAAIKAGSSVEDMSEVVFIHNLAAIRLSVRIWYEYVPSALNISDPLSREGLSDPSVAGKLSSGEWRHANLTVDWNPLKYRMAAADEFIAAR